MLSPRPSRPVLLPATGRSGRVAAAARQGGTAAAGSALLAVLLALLCWLPDVGTGAHPGGVVRAGLLAFLAANHGGVTVAGTPMTFLPLGALLLVLAVLWRSSGALTAGGTPALDVPGFAAGYAAVCAVLTPFAAVGGSSPGLRTLLAAPALAALVSAGRLVRAGRMRLRPPGWLTAAVRPAGVAVAGYLAVGALAVAGSLVWHAGTVERLSASVGGGLSGAPLLLVGVLTAPNAVVAGAAYAAGPGFAVGSGIGAFSAGHGVLPAFPLVGAVPAGRAPVGVLVVLLAAVATSGAAAGLLAARQRGLVPGLRCAALSGLLAGAAMAVLAWQAGGAVGSGRLRDVGASPLWTGLAVGAETAVLAAVLVCARALRTWLRARNRARRGRRWWRRWERSAGEPAAEKQAPQPARV